MKPSPSIAPSWTSRLATRLSGQAPGRLGNSAGVLGGRGTPTSMRGRFAKFGSMYGEEAGAKAALLPTVQAQQANATGNLAATQAAANFDAGAYETQQRQQRGMPPPTGGTGQIAGEASILPDFWKNRSLPMMKSAGKPAPYQPPQVGSMLPKPAATPYVGHPRVGPLDPGRFNLGNRWSEGYSRQISKVGVT